MQQYSTDYHYVENMKTTGMLPNQNALLHLTPDLTKKMNLNPTSHKNCNKRYQMNHDNFFTWKNVFIEAKLNRKYFKINEMTMPSVRDNIVTCKITSKDDSFHAVICNQILLQYD